MKFYFLGLLFILTYNLLFAQHETDQRVIGFKYIMKFNGTNPQVETTSSNLYDPFNPNYKGDLQTPHANSICDTLGNLLFYYDGTSVHQSNGEVMNNGTLHDYNFSSYYNNALIVPIEESNRRYYYLFETVPYEENWNYITNRPLEDVSSCYYPNECGKFWDLCKLQYHVIDIQANGGSGGVLKKNIFIADSVAPSISGIKHQNNIDTWISVLKYRTNNIFNYKVNSCAIQAPVISTIPDFEYKKKPLYVPYSVASNTGFQLVYSTKGDYAAFPGNKISDINPPDSDIPLYLFIAPFDNQTGLFDFSILKTIDVRSGGDDNFFSHDSKYLYYNNSGFFVPVWMYQYELSTGNSTPMYYNDIPPDNNYSGLDYGKNNDILIYKVKVKPNKSAFKCVSYLGEISNINQPFVPGNLIDSLLLPGIDQPDNNPLYTYIARNNYIYNFYHPDYKKPPAFPAPVSVVSSVASPSCFTSPVVLAGHATGAADSAYWYVQKEPAVTWQKYVTDTFNLTVNPGTYQASYVSYKYCLGDSATQQFVIEDYPHVQLPIDSVYTCDSKPVDLPAIATSYQSYWVNAAGNTVVSPLPDPGVYAFVVQNSCDKASDSLYVKNSVLDVTNLVTANNDTQNDCLYAVSNNPTEKIRLSIYNCWGSRIFYEENYSNNWCPGTEVSDGVYFYETVYNNNCNKKGWVQVVH